jgi:hypothetical protein
VLGAGDGLRNLGKPGIKIAVSKLKSIEMDDELDPSVGFNKFNTPKSSID